MRGGEHTPGHSPSGRGGGGGPEGPAAGDTPGRSPEGGAHRNQEAGPPFLLAGQGAGGRARGAPLCGGEFGEVEDVLGREGDLLASLIGQGVVVDGREVREEDVGRLAGLPPGPPLPAGGGGCSR